MPGPRFSRKRAIGDSGPVASSSSIRLSPQRSIATRTPSCGTSSIASTVSPRASQKPRASAIEATAMPMWSMFISSPPHSVVPTPTLRGRGAPAPSFYRRAPDRFLRLAPASRSTTPAYSRSATA